MCNQLVISLSLKLLFQKTWIRSTITRNQVQTFYKSEETKRSKETWMCSVCALLGEDIRGGGFIVCWSLRRNVTKSLLPLKREQAVSLYDPCIRIVIRQTVWFWTVSIEFQYYCGAGGAQLTALSHLAMPGTLRVNLSWTETGCLPQVTCAVFLHPIYYLL